MSRSRFIHAEQATYPVPLLCRVRGGARSGDDAWTRRAVSARARAAAALIAPLAAGQARRRRTDSAPRVHAELRARGVRCARQRVARRLREAALVGCHRRRRARTTVADPAQAPAPNLVAREFTAAVPHRRWLGDSTSVPTWEGWLYLAVLVEGYSRRVVGWARADHRRAALATEALALARQRRRPMAGLVHHTERGCQDPAEAYRALLAAPGVTGSMSRAGACLDNARAERCCATRKAELVDTRTWPTRAAARQAIFAWLEIWYHRQRRHAALGYRSPVAWEEQVVLLQDTAA